MAVKLMGWLASLFRRVLRRRKAGLESSVVKDRNLAVPSSRSPELFTEKPPEVTDTQPSTEQVQGIEILQELPQNMDARAKAVLQLSDINPQNKGAYEAALEEIDKESDIIIAVMGVTGAGKTSFIKAIAGDKGREAGHNLDAGTDTVNCVKIPIPNTKSGLVLVDTPGFDDPKRDNGEILKVIAKWLKESYQGGKHLNGIVYLHRITDIRFDSGSSTTLTLFKHLCGGEVFDKISFTTTKWNDVRPDLKADHETKEKNLKKDQWGVFMAKGSITSRFDSTTDELAVQTAKKTVLALLNGTTTKLVTQIQKEMVDQRKPIYKTEAGKYAFTTEQRIKEQLFQLNNMLVTDSSA
ncbi:P-loop containing nucleoside triphosphate hydrolase protein [Panaeolus papilionaceus]|nr:P-loop containing nucleoside triphosphate hydrolase protein [Panaeolus papilionaceus]